MTDFPQVLTKGREREAPPIGKEAEKSGMRTKPRGTTWSKKRRRNSCEPSVMILFFFPRLRSFTFLVESHFLPQCRPIEIVLSCTQPVPAGGTSSRSDQRGLCGAWDRLKEKLKHASSALLAIVSFGYLVKKLAVPNFRFLLHLVHLSFPRLLRAESAGGCTSNG